MVYCFSTVKGFFMRNDRRPMAFKELSSRSNDCFEFCGEAGGRELDLDKWPFILVDGNV